MSDIGRLAWSGRAGEGQARLDAAWVSQAHRLEHLDLLQDCIADLQAKYDACLANMPGWQHKTFADREAIDAALEAREKAVLPGDPALRS